MLSAAQREQLIKRLGLSVQQLVPSAPEADRLVAYFTVELSNEQADADSISEELRSYLEARLPHHLVPSQLIHMSRLPRTPTGKIDRQALATALPAPPEAEAKRSEPEGPGESALVEIWRRLFGTTEIRVDDNFFEIGGDSLLTIEMTSMARQKGLKIQPQDIFEYPTIRLLAANAGSELETSTTAETGPEAGFLLPIHHWLVEMQGGFPDRWNMTHLFEIPGGVSGEQVRGILNRIVSHHGMLRATVRRLEGEWSLEVDGDSGIAMMTEVDSSDWTEGEFRSRLEDLVAQVNGQILPTDGVCVRFVVLRTVRSRPDLLLVAAHHAVVDLVSWRILQQDLDYLFTGIVRGRRVELPPRTTSVGFWARVLDSQANASWLARELPFWKRQVSSKIRVPRDLIEGERNKELDARQHSLVVDGDAAPLVVRANKMDVRPNELALATVARSIAEWMNSDHVLFGLESHGRQQAVDSSVDLSRTIGWLTVTYPLIVSLERRSAFIDDVMAIRDQLRAVPGSGLGYGTLRYLISDEDVRSQLSPIVPEILFNYVGSETRGGESAVRSAGFILEHNRSPELRRAALIEITAGIRDGQFFFDWSYNYRIHLESTIRLLAQRTGDLLHRFVEDTSSASDQGTVQGLRLSDDDLGSLIKSLDA